MRVLLVEDDALLADGLVRSLRQTGYSVDWTSDGEEAETILRVQDYDLIVLDLTLPQVDGLDLLLAIRNNRSDVPVLIITARSEVEDRIRGLDLGADDYLTKPFEMGEFDARVRALLRRGGGSATNSLTCGDLEFDLSARRVFVNNAPMELPRRELHILEQFLSNRGHILSKDQIAERISDFEEELNPSAVEIYIHRLRKKLEGSGVVIRTVRGIGYLIE